MKFLFTALILTLSLTGCDVNADKASAEGQYIDLSEIDEAIKSQDDNEKLNYFNALLVKAEDNDPIVQNLVGVVFKNGYLNQKMDIKKAVHWYEKAIKNNNGVAENNMGKSICSWKGSETRL